MKHSPFHGAGTLTLEPDGTATGCNPVQVGSTPTGVSDMKGETMKTSLVRTFLDHRRQPLAATTEIAKFLDELCREAPEFCAQVLADATTHVTQKALLLAGVVRAAVDRQQIVQALGSLSDTDLLHVQYPLFLGYAAIREARRLGIPVICSFHLQPENILLNLGLSGRWMTNLVYRLFCRYFYQRADLIIAPTEFAADRFPNGILFMAPYGSGIVIIDDGRGDAFRPDLAGVWTWAPSG